MLGSDKNDTYDFGSKKRMIPMTTRHFSRLALVAATSFLLATPALAETLRLGTVVSAPHPGSTLLKPSRQAWKKRPMAG